MPTFQLAEFDWFLMFSEWPNEILITFLLLLYFKLVTRPE